MQGCAPRNRHRAFLLKSGHRDEEEQSSHSVWLVPWYLRWWPGSPDHPTVHVPTAFADAGCRGSRSSGCSHECCWERGPGHRQLVGWASPGPGTSCCNKATHTAGNLCTVFLPWASHAALHCGPATAARRRALDPSATHPNHCEQIACCHCPSPVLCHGVPLSTVGRAGCCQASLGVHASRQPQLHTAADVGGVTTVSSSDGGRAREPSAVPVLAPQR